MNPSITVVLTDTSIALVSKNSILTTIPLRHWTSNNGSTWSGRLRPDHEVTWLMERLRDKLRDDGNDSLMKRVSQVLSEEPPPPPTKKEESDDKATSKRGKVDQAIVNTVKKRVKKSPVGRYMPGVRAPAPRVKPVEVALMAPQ